MLSRRALVGAGLGLAVTIGGPWALRELPANAQAGRQQVPLFEPDPLWSQALPNKWVTGAVGGIAVDSHDNVWVFHREASIPDGEKAASLTPPQAECCIPAPAVLEFDVPPGCKSFTLEVAGNRYTQPIPEEHEDEDDHDEESAEAPEPPQAQPRSSRHRH